ncbi:TetR/AcrR family transcriptional regulator [Nocardioides pocheonensis]|uniref:TetR/AcrR family transcriptional regulator n=2 Tax=Nocardioides pocheonensis TaxID=661485 RepID=A0A3N0GHL7_9ACTN|nr:TetR/AcrR family transcriptional regulator [Nocardioides pocheonensis]
MRADPSPELGMRERKKKDSMARLQTAARELMWAKGYEAVTTKEIALQADMGEATLFRYVPSKLDLFLLVYGQEFEKVVDDCEGAIAKLLDDSSTHPDSYVKRILASYDMFAQLYKRYPELAFTFVKESFGTSTAVGSSGLEYADRWFGLLEQVLERGQQAGALVAMDTPVVVQNCHALYVHEVLRSHARRLPKAAMPKRLRHRLATLLEPLQASASNR